MTDLGPDPMRDCEHGRLKRSCAECDSEAEIASLRAALDRVEALAGQIERSEDPQLDSPTMAEVARALRAAIRGTPTR